MQSNIEEREASQREARNGIAPKLLIKRSTFWAWSPLILANFGFKVDSKKRPKSLHWPSAVSMWAALSPAVAATASFTCSTKPFLLSPSCSPSSMLIAPTCANKSDNDDIPDSAKTKSTCQDASTKHDAAPNTSVAFSSSLLSLHMHRGSANFTRHCFCNFKSSGTWLGTEKSVTRCPWMTDKAWTQASNTMSPCSSHRPRLTMPSASFFNATPTG
mmetsp:Transcript_14578/g.29536  ORF Transcript_14578/g.29536 Transcript_14578/m.29536 type:complete len:216 (+) Transcript_14578:1717-2364(+)